MNPFDVVDYRYQKEKSGTLLALRDSERNPSASRCKTPKYVFVVRKTASKPQIKWAIESIYSEKRIQVLKVNTICVKPKRVRMRSKKSTKSSLKKAVVTLREGDDLDAV